jgi:peroxiredoxin Q/BCP
MEALNLALDFSLPATGGQAICPAGLHKTVVLYFYPKDNTSGCTVEAQEFRDLFPEFEKAGATVLGVSRDSVRSHENFKAKLGLPFELLADTDAALCRRFDVLKPKKMYGKDVVGLVRSTFVFSAEGKLLREWRGVKAPGHAAEVLAFVASLAA